MTTSPLPLGEGWGEGVTAHLPPIHALWLGRLDYDTAHEMQTHERDRVIAGESAGTLLLLEHEPVVTLGRRGDLGDLLVPRDALEARGIAVRETERGGRATYHGPGQLVGYPIAPLSTLAPDVPTYVWRLEETLICVARAVGVHAARRADARGVWVGPAKLGFIGVAISRRVCWHGFSLNAGARPEAFDLIRSCGLDAPTTADRKSVV